MNRAFKSLAMMAAMMAAADRPSANLYEVEEQKQRLYCGDCEHCPSGNKTYCKEARRHTHKTTNATNCKYYKLKIERSND